ncbi:rhodanese-related sulfurtransferase [Salinibacter ruber]|uniref:Rhodanese-related sulfurtransferase n=1 Tax=Salinibacter ruber TaxID=146919 RepID=A0AAW5PCP9_9BACT|nr:metalloregulator ArsR/SmtB family transcription factor [Salinibacter ruber]MCS3665667.1 rhodanese-related sulfurtransferase [Salinibacter ruber]MCS4159368.1 rhodanese-related sulfurtransferase [Salinibacter ruber]MCS4223834.1 rhodanese-related sulfurtransferase [Salinibacter ruber]
MEESKERQFKDALYREFARIGKTLSSGRRLEMIDVLVCGEQTVSELASATGLTRANTSQHLRTLKQARLVEGRKDGKQVYYSLADERVYGLWRALREVGEQQLAEIDRIVDEHMRSREDLEPVGMDELLERMQEGEAEAIDVRPKEEYRNGHIAGARSVPVEELATRADDLPSEVEVVAYCRGPFCILSDRAVEILRDVGIEARRLEEGYPDWKAEGYPIERV